MILFPAARRIPRRRGTATPRHAFTLVEVALALAVIGIVFVALLGLIPAGVNASRQATDSTVTAVILENLHNRLQGQALTTGPAAFSPAYFDVHGVLIPPDDEEALQERIYRADVVIGDWHQRPKGTSGLRPVTIAVSWPVNSVSGEPAAGNPKTTVTYVATAITGKDWTAIDPAHREKIEF